MRVRCLAACLITAGALVAAPPALAVTNFRTTQQDAAGVSCDPPFAACMTFSASSASFSDGTTTGSIQATLFDQSTSSFTFFSCSGPEFGGIVAVNPNGVTTISGVIDVDSPNCLAVNVAGIVTVDLSGVPDGTFSSSQHATGTIVNASISQRFNSKDEGFGVAFSGSNGLASGSFTGSAQRSRRVQLDK